MLIKFPSGNIINTDLVRRWYIDDESHLREGKWATRYSLFAVYINGDYTTIHESYTKGTDFCQEHEECDLGKCKVEKRVAKSECEHLLDKIAEEHLRPQARPVLIQELVDQVRENLSPENERSYLTL